MGNRGEVRGASRNGGLAGDSSVDGHADGLPGRRLLGGELAQAPRRGLAERRPFTVAKGLARPVVRPRRVVCLADDKLAPFRTVIVVQMASL